MSKVTNLMARCIDKFDSFIDRLPLIRAKICLDLASRLLAHNQRLFNRMIAYATTIIEEEGAEV